MWSTRSRPNCLTYSLLKNFRRWSGPKMTMLVERLSSTSPWAPTWRARGRPSGRWLAGAAAVLLACALAGALYLSQRTKAAAHEAMVLDLIADMPTARADLRCVNVSSTRTQRLGITPVTYTLSAGVGRVGLRGLRLCMRRPDLFATQLRALLRQAGRQRAQLGGGQVVDGGAAPA